MKKLITLSLVLLIFTSVTAQLPLTLESPFVKVVENIRESVVNIQVEYEVKMDTGQLPFNDEFFRFFFPDIPRAPQSRKSYSMGSGFIFDQDGKDVYIITNNHVVQEGQEGEITVTLADKAKYEAEIVGLDSETDLAVIKIEVEDSEEVVEAPLGNSDEIKVGAWAIAIGNPFGQLGLDRTVTVGVISATGRSNLNFGQDSPIYQDYIQTDAAINPGNSGGPLLNIKGEVIGVNAAITTPNRGNVGIGFAIPINMAKKVVTDLIDVGKVRRAYLGIRPQEITPELKESLELKEVAGVLVAQVMEDTPAEKAGLKAGDVILEFNGKKIPNVSKFMITVANSEIGEEIPLKISRNGKIKTLTVKLTERNEDILAKNSSKPQEEKLLGVEVTSLDSEFAERYNIEADYGVVITSVSTDSPARKAGLEAGMVIMEIDNEPVKNVKDFKKALADLKKDVVLLRVKTRDDNYMFVAIKLDK
ncbi:MAG TPA: protease degQ [Candidatus Cloacimonas sp.]|nr:protease degQ [Candidatus Cloacimonas sp.]